MKLYELFGDPDEDRYEQKIHRINEDIFKFLNGGSGQQDYQSNDEEELDKEK